MSELQLANACGSICLSAKNFVSNIKFSNLCESHKLSKTERLKPELSIKPSRSPSPWSCWRVAWAQPSSNWCQHNAQYTQVTVHHHHHVAHLEEALSRCLRLTHTSVPDVERNILASLFKITVTTEMIARYNSTEAPPAPSSSSNPGQHWNGNLLKQINSIY